MNNYNLINFISTIINYYNNIMRNSNVIGKSFSGDHSLRNIIKLTSKNK